MDSKPRRHEVQPRTGNRYTDPAFPVLLGGVRVSQIQADRLENHCKTQRVSKADVVRQGIDAVLAQSGKSAKSAAQGAK